VGNIKDLLGLSPQEVARTELKLKLADARQDQQQSRRIRYKGPQAE
jgi:hypothetical protein